MKQAQQQSLFPSLPVARPAPRILRPVPRPAFIRHRASVWLAVFLPDFALEVLSRGQAVNTPQAVIDSSGRTPRICTVDARAAQGGVRPGMTLAAAWSLVPNLDVHERDDARERRMLQRLAAWAGCFTPTVCLDRQTLLLEVRGSLQLFDGAKALQENVRAGLAQLGFSSRVASAPTPRAALWLAHAGREIHIDQPDSLADTLGDLPLCAAGFEESLQEMLRGIGARRLRDLMRLPRDGFARRYSVKALRELDQALGRVADVRHPLPPRKEFSTRIELLYEITETERLLHPVRQLLHELSGYLQATQQGVSRLRLELFHRDKSSTCATLGFAEATREMKRMHDLMERKLETVALAAPVLEVMLRAEEMIPLAGRDSALFIEQRDGEDWPQLVERLATRLGTDAVCSVETRADHRPEHAWRFVVPGSATESTGIAGRPHWLLEEPRALRAPDDAPLCDGPLEILDGPERIETGWWSGIDVARDYYVARDVHARRLWICREVKSGCWWLHGVFA